MSAVATRTAAELAAEAATAQAVKAATEQATKLATEQATKAATEQATKAATEQATKAATEQATKAATEQATKQASEQAAKDAAEQAAKKASKISPEDVAKYAAGAAAAGLGLYTYIKAKDAADQSNNTPRGITKIEYASSTSKSMLKITFTPSIKILLADEITFRETKTTPALDGVRTVNKVISSSQIQVDFGSDKITTLDPGGFIDVKTTVAAQAGANIADTGRDLGSGFFDGLGLGFGDMTETFKTVCLIIVCLIMCGLLAWGVSKMI
jgi:hypothetical protein